MPKHVLVALPLSDAQRSALQASVPEYEFIFARAASGTTRSIVSFGYEDFKYRLGKR